MQSMNRPGIHKTGRQMVENELVTSSPLMAVIKFFVAFYTAILNFMHWVRMLRAGARPLNELTLEGLYMKELEIFYFDFFDYKTWEKAKDIIRCLITANVISLAFYIMATYLMDLDLRVRVMGTCIISTLLTLLLSYSSATRAVTFLMIPSLSSGALRNSLLLAALVLLTAGPASNLRSNLDAISASKSCLHEQFFDIVGVVKACQGKNVVNLLIIPVRLALASMQVVAEVMYRTVNAIYLSLAKLMKAMRKLLSSVSRMMKRIGSFLSFPSSCRRLTRSIARRFRRTRLLAGLIQMFTGLVNLVRSVTGSTPIAKPTIGYFVHEIGSKSVCPLLRSARNIIQAKKKKLREWWQAKVLNRINEIKAVFKLIFDAIGPGTRVTVTMKGGVAHQLAELKRQMTQSMNQKAKEVKGKYRSAMRVVKIVCSVLSLGVFSITLLLSTLFYRNYMRRDDFENNFVTAPFLRLEELEPPILPLDAYEKSRVSILSETMISDAVRRLAGSDILLALIRLMPFIVVMMLEFILYHMAAFLENSWNHVIKLERTVDTRLNIKSAKEMAETNPMALLLVIIIQMQKALRSINLDINILACAPKAIEPNWSIDVLISLLLLLYTLLTLFGPFFLKLRHHIMLELEPARAVQRAVWLRRQIQADRQLLPANRDLLFMSQFEKEDGSLKFLYNTYVKDGLSTLADQIRIMLNLPTTRCASCGIRGNLSMRNFNDFFTICDSCQSSVCAPCAHFTDRNGVVRLRENCPKCGLKMEDVDIDAEEIEDEDPLDDMLFNFLDLRPGYKISRSALNEHLKDIKKFEEETAMEEERSFINTLGADATINPKDRGESAKVSSQQ